MSVSNWAVRVGSRAEKIKAGEAKRRSQPEREEAKREGGKDEGAVPVVVALNR